MRLFTKVMVMVVIAAVLLTAFQAKANDPFRKLGRGIVNVGAGGLEVPMKIYDVNEEEDAASLVEADEMTAEEEGFLKGYHEASRGFDKKEDDSE